jgi:polysaccharide pyruvyl transferase WcaK-like protein
VRATYSTIGLLDHMGWGNMGDAAVQEAFIANIRKRLPNAQLIAFSLNPDDTALRHGLQCYPIIWSYLRGVASDSGSIPPPQHGSLKAALKKWRFVYAIAKPIHDLAHELVHLIRSYWAVRSLDVLIISGGGQLSELWRGPWSHPYNIFKFSVLAKLSRTPLLIVGVGAGPLEHPLSKFFVRWSVRLARYTSLRDQESEKLLRILGATAPIDVSPDPAYALPIADYVRPTTSRSVRPKVGINPIGYCDPRVWAHQDVDAYLRYLDELEAFCGRLLERGYDIEIFTAEISVDRYAIQELRERLAKHVSSSGGATVECISKLDLKGLLTQMSTFDFVITSKFHGVIFSHLLGKPVVALSYHRKIDDLMRKVGHEEYCLPAGSFTSKNLTAAFDTLVRHEERLRGSFYQTARANSDAVEAQFDRLFEARPDETIAQRPPTQVRELAAAEEHRP